jgi:hypothetical protein
MGRLDEAREMVERLRAITSIVMPGTMPSDAFDALAGFFDDFMLPAAPP